MYARKLRTQVEIAKWNEIFHMFQFFQDIRTTLRGISKIPTFIPGIFKFIPSESSPGIFRIFGGMDVKKT